MNFSNDSEEKVFNEIFDQLPTLIKDKCSDYDELYGYKLNYNDSKEKLVEQYYDEDIAKALIFKICKAYQFDKTKIITSIVDILNWRKSFNPLSAAYKETHNEALQTVGLLTSYPDDEPNKRVVTWNLYGQIVKKKELFKDSSKFIRYRIGLMERGLRLLDFNNDANNYMTQVHDYKGVSMFRLDSEIKACTKQVIAIFQKYYPELLYAKYFVNVPSILSWMYDLMKSFIDEQTRKKFVVLNDGNKLGNYLKSCPSENYGGTDKKNNLQKQDVDTPRPTPYALYILESQANEDID
ncbi:hypothetical protein Kpol_1060p52 [Vanderwaltozyma polyspora DSM 70294]|uniref:Phosphatidylinositol transfer protein SFH5 n=1 Tax=Vanderwaltozyma polyspora (strain ATCC 22028 / DSM 70294 / BCRC 21397 / CBS 2163 / NBRC 10782 / NRRL Y-8283 / UCD 57-17) TaxID=436907 RepID=SFH5_VANPO|nr:uncharacterized protein Kpol_1060p52 [Vanderwaltozyma polyspora DSM 70294]A7TK50.1 RecName: Full=Phosphatidylinositol transfer protein SFH5; Short=PITP SFH5 [Vanderwaltozyma polyspora DSM 70294]EDO17396.1 hypothetical protein Kpol_1060p52 [Vanderwaltozyma polyspora DSM 70294]